MQHINTATLLPYFLCILAMTSCSEEPSRKGLNSPPPKNVEQWFGTYQSTHPCSDCDSMQTTVQISSAEAYIRKFKYYSDDPARGAVIELGRLTWDDSLQTITLSDEGGVLGMYALAPDTLIYLDSDGKRLTDKDASSYNLLRLDTSAAILLR